MTSLRALASLHGQLGFLAAAALLHPAITMRHGAELTRRMRTAIGLSTAFAVGAFSLGVAIYENYRRIVKRDLFAVSTAAGFGFETKEHLAFVVVALAIGGCACALIAPAEERGLRRAASAAYLTASLLAAIAVGLGVWVSAVHGFPE